MAIQVSTALLLALVLSCTHAATSRRSDGDSSATTSYPVTDELTLVTSPDGSYHIDVMNTTWLTSGDTYFRSDGKEFSLSEGSLRSLGTTESQGRDTLGEWRDVTTTWSAGRVLVQTSFRLYVSPPLPAVLFKQKYLNDTRRTAVWDPNMVMASFPSFLDREAALPLGFLAFGGMMLGDTAKAFGLWGRSLLNIVTGISGGPLAVFDQHGRVVVVSPASQFMSVNNWHDSLARGSLHWGTMGWVDSVPASHELSVILYYGNSGVNQAFEDWGAVMRKMYGRDDTLVKQDLTISHIGYWTDNGAYYYYHTEKNKTYEETILDINNYIHKEGIPFKYLQYDSWWYYKGLLTGVANWTSMPQIFPHGMEYVYKQTGLPVSAHNRFWSRDTTYAKQNGGKYNFVVGLLLAVPDDQQFWIDLFTEAKTWGLITYEQDWLNDETFGEGSLLSNLTLGDTWLTQMGKGAEVTGLTIQYCMSLPRHALMALKIPQVTQARVSDDYAPGEGQWRVGTSSLLALALGLAPFKDTFWTTPLQPGNIYNEQEPHTTLQSAVSTLSTGPVGPSDMIGAINTSVLMRCCNADGLILKPSRPATAIDAQILGKAFGTPQGQWGSSEVWSTFSNITGLQFGILLVADLTLPYLDVRPSDMGLSQAERVIFPRGSPHALTEFSQQRSIRVSNCSTTDFCLFYSPPLITMGTGHRVAVLGELDKWVPVSPQRVSSISITTDVTLELRGVAGENIDFLVSKDATISAIKCVFGASGEATLSINKMACG